MRPNFVATMNCASQFCGVVGSQNLRTRLAGAHLDGAASRPGLERLDPWLYLGTQLAVKLSRNFHELLPDQLEFINDEFVMESPVDSAWFPGEIRQRAYYAYCR